jgi:hypothetical protein
MLYLKKCVDVFSMKYDVGKEGMDVPELGIDGRSFGEAFTLLIYPCPCPSSTMKIRVRLEAVDSSLQFPQFRSGPVWFLKAPHSLGM